MYPFRWTQTLLFIFFTSFFCYAIENNTNLQDIKKRNNDAFIKKTIDTYKEEILKYSEEKDTIPLIENHIKLSNFYAHIADYGNAYNGYWEALILADKTKNKFFRARVHQALGWLYIFYHKDQKALENFTASLKLDKQLVRDENIHPNYLISDYFALANYERKKKDFLTTRKYLDSCARLEKKLGIVNHYVQCERAYLDANAGKYDLALNKLNTARSHFEKENPAYLIVIDYLLGNTFEFQGNTEEAIKHYHRSLDLTNKHYQHLNYRLFNHNTLGKLYSQEKNYELAFHHAVLGQEMQEEIYGVKSLNSEVIFEINDKYRIQKEKEKGLIKEQLIELLKKDQRLGQLKTILLIVTILSLITIGYFVIKNIKQKHLEEKQKIQTLRDVERKDAERVLALKNKELTSSALQLIEKEEFIKKLKENVHTTTSSNSNIKVINQMIKSVESSTSNKWEEFEARFTSINQNFYKNLKNRFPGLSQKDLKVCALIKLNFSSKDMASLLGISVESVHTSRYRLRKKLNLERSENLSDFIAQF